MYGKSGEHEIVFIGSLYQFEAQVAVWSFQIDGWRYIVHAQSTLRQSVFERRDVRPSFPVLARLHQNLVRKTVVVSVTGGIFQDEAVHLLRQVHLDIRMLVERQFLVRPRAPGRVEERVRVIVHEVVEILSIVRRRIGRQLLGLNFYLLGDPLGFCTLRPYLVLHLLQGHFILVGESHRVGQRTVEAVAAHFALLQFVADISLGCGVAQLERRRQVFSDGRYGSLKLVSLPCCHDVYIDIVIIFVVEFKSSQVWQLLRCFSQSVKHLAWVSNNRIVVQCYLQSSVALSVGFHNIGRENLQPRRFQIDEERVSFRRRQSVQLRTEKGKQCTIKYSFSHRKAKVNINGKIKNTYCKSTKNSEFHQ
ncbi:hypothetical protein EVA_15436 [gut metagenome]|uniref:Uncharacterized protein n=1 Tax=gut metagenome TaxID=749906 RepID=J9FND6_9ZZZZ